MKALAFLLSLLFAPNMASCSAVSPRKSLTSSRASYVITDVTIVDVENGITIPEQAVVISGERISQIDDQKKIQIPSEAIIIDGHGLYAIPSLVDAHVHYYDESIFGRLLLANGVLLVRDMGMPNDYILPIREALNSGTALGPEMVTTGLMLDGQPPIIPAISVGVATPEDGRAFVRQQAEAGVNMIKTYSRLEKDVFLAILAEARKVDLPVAAHLPESVYIEDAAVAGLSSSEHFNGFEKVIAKLLGEPARYSFVGQAADAGFLARLDEVEPDKLRAVFEHLRSTGITICPTVVTFKTLTNLNSIQGGNFPGSQYIPKSLQDMWKTLWLQQEDLPDFIWTNWMSMVVELNRSGVPLMIGTDLMLPGILPGFSVHEEMGIWQDAGISAKDILRSATIVPAQVMRLADSMGSVSVGKTASIVLVRGNPLEDIRNAQKVESIFLRGQYFSRDYLNQLLDEATVTASSITTL